MTSRRSSAASTSTGMTRSSDTCGVLLPLQLANTIIDKDHADILVKCSGNQYDFEAFECIDRSIGRPAIDVHKSLDYLGS